MRKKLEPPSASVPNASSTFEEGYGNQRYYEKKTKAMRQRCASDGHTVDRSQFFNQGKNIELNSDSGSESDVDAQVEERKSGESELQFEMEDIGSFRPSNS